MQKSLGAALSRGIRKIPQWKSSSIIHRHGPKFSILKYDKQRSFHVAVKLLQSEPKQQQQQEDTSINSPSLEWPDPLWLRDACSCKLCVDPSSKQKRFQTSDIPLDIDILHKETGHNGSLIVTWSNDIQGFGSDHVSQYAKDFIWPTRRIWQKSKRPLIRLPHYWDKDLIEKAVKFVDFGHYMSRDNVVYDVLNQLKKYGLVFLRNVPESAEAIEDIASRIGPLKNTFYGLTWDVKSVPKAKNVAYTHQYLGLHMDLLYMDQPPALQLLHCLKNTCDGGSSMFCDSWHAASQLQEQDMQTFGNLLRLPTTFEYDNAGQRYSQERPVIATRGGERGQITAVNWSPPFQAPFVLQPGGELDYGRLSAFRSYAKALKQFAARLESHENIYEYRMKEGECVIFDNKRVLHARRAFDISSGERWLKGAYIDRDVWNSRHVVLDRIFRPLVAWETSIAPPPFRKE